jgi:hypothetical protein
MQLTHLPKWYLYYASWLRVYNSYITATGGYAIHEHTQAQQNDEGLTGFYVE